MKLNFTKNQGEIREGKQKKICQTQLCGHVHPAKEKEVDSGLQFQKNYSITQWGKQVFSQPLIVQAVYHLKKDERGL